MLRNLSFAVLISLCPVFVLGQTVVDPAPSTDEAPASEPAGSDSEEALLADIEAALAADADASESSTAQGLTMEAPLPESQVAQTTPVQRFLQSMNPEISLILDVALAAFSSDDPLMTGAHDPQENGFNLQQLEFATSALVDPYFRFDAFIVFSQFGVEIEEAYATTLSLPLNLQARMGQFLTRLGRLNETHPHSWEFVDQPFINGRFLGGEGNRGLGAEVSVLMPLPWYVEFAISSTDARGEATARSFFGGGPTALTQILSPLDLQWTAVLDQFFPFNDDWSLSWGLGWAVGPNPTGYNNYTNIGAMDLYLKFKPATAASWQEFRVTVEGMVRARQVPGDRQLDFGGYASVFWKFARRWAVAARYEIGSPSFGIDGEIIDSGPGLGFLTDPAWTDYRHRIGANITFWPTEFSRLRLQTALDLPLWRVNPEFMVFFAGEVLAGAHGAHKF